MASGKNHDRSILFASPLVLVVGCWQFGELGIIAGASHFLDRVRFPRSGAVGWIRGDFVTP